MIKISDFLGKPVLALYDAQTIGTATDILFDSKLKKAKCIKVFQDEDDTLPETLYIPLRSVKDLLSDTLAIASRHHTQNAWALPVTATSTNPINSSCYNQDGKLLGIVRDILLTDGNVTAIIVDNKQYTPLTLLSQSSTALIFNDTGKPIKLKAPKKIKVPSVDTTRTSSVKVHEPFLTKGNNLIPLPSNSNLNDLSAMTNLPISPMIDELKTQFLKVKNFDASPNTKEVSYPTRVPQEKTSVSRSPAASCATTAAYAFLIGKTLSRALCDDNGNILIRQHDTVTEDNIAACKQYGKLVQLALYAD